MFTPTPEEMIQFDELIFQLGWFNHQLDDYARKCRKNLGPRNAIRWCRNLSQDGQLGVSETADALVELGGWEFSHPQMVGSFVRESPGPKTAKTYRNIRTYIRLPRYLQTLFSVGISRRLFIAHMEMEKKSGIICGVIHVLP